MTRADRRPRPPRAIKSRRPRRRRVLRVLPRARGRRRPQRLHLGGRTTPELRRRTAPLAGVPDRDQGPVLHRGRPEPGRLEDPRGLPPAVHGDVASRSLQAAGAHAAGQDQPGRVRDGLLHRELRLRADAEPVGHDARARRLERRQRRRASPPARRRGRSAPTPAARSASPPRCAGSSASSRPTARSAATG